MYTSKNKHKKNSNNTKRIIRIMTNIKSIKNTCSYIHNLN